MIGKAVVRAMTSFSILRLSPEARRKIAVGAIHQDESHCPISQREAMPLALLPLHPHEDLLPFQQNAGAVLIV
jgi:hypothetical protein